MLDLSRRHSRNQYGKQPSIDFKRISSAALMRAPSLVCKWLPNGQPRGHEWVALNPRRADRSLGSFCINLRTGCWADFAVDGARGNDLISLKAYLHDINQGTAARRLAEEIGL